MKTKPRDDSSLGCGTGRELALNVLNSIGLRHTKASILDGMRILELDRSIEALYKLKARDVIVQVKVAIGHKKADGQPTASPTTQDVSKRLLRYVSLFLNEQFRFDVRIFYDAHHFSVSHSPYISWDRNVLGPARSISSNVLGAIELARNPESNSALQKLLRDGNGFATRESVEKILRCESDGR